LLAPSARKVRATELLAQGSDANAIGALADALSTQDLKAKLALVPPIYRLLPAVTPAIAADLSPHQREQLRKLLLARNLDKEAELITVLADAMVVMKDTASLQPMRLLAQRKASTASGSRAQSHINQCIDALENIQAMEDDATSLLRAGKPNADTLLRPSAYERETPAEQLLRPGSANRDTN
jgi:hypothetical protein